MSAWKADALPLGDARIMDANFTPSRGLGQVAFSKFKIMWSPVELFPAVGTVFNHLKSMVLLHDAETWRRAITPVKAFRFFAA